MAKIGELLVEINGDNSGLKKTFSQTTQHTNQFTKDISKGMGSVNDLVVNAAKQFGYLSVAIGAIGLAMKGIDYNKASEQAEIAFGVFLGSAGAAKDMIEELRDLAKETPLEFAEVRDAAKRLSAFGIEADKVVPAMRRLADVSAGLQIPIGDLAYLFGTIKTQGKAMTVDINQFANRGIPIWEELAKVTGKAGTELRKLVEEGGVGFPQIEQAFANMTNEGGKFFEMAKKQMDSLAGSQSNLNDAFDVWLGHMTEGLNGPLKEFNNFWAGFFSGWVSIDKQTSGTMNNIDNALKKLADDVNPMVQLFRALGIESGFFRDNIKEASTVINSSAGLGDFKEARKTTAAKIAADKLAAEALAKKNAEQAKANKLLADEAQLYRDNSVTYLQFIDLERQRQILAKETPADLEKLATAEQIVSGYRLAAFAAEFEAMRLNNQVTDEAVVKVDLLQERMVSLADFLVNGFSASVQTMIEGPFTALGTALKEQTDAWDALRKGVLHSIGAIVKGIGDKLAAMAAADFTLGLAAASNPITALGAPGFFAASAIEGSGAAAAYATAGFLSAYANGTDFARGGLSLVGERGPELVNLPRGSQVKTAEETSRMMGSSNATIELYLDSKIIAESTVKLIDNGRVRLRSLAG